MLIRSKRSKKSELLERMNHQHSSAGQQIQQDCRQFQAEMQHRLSNEVRKNMKDGVQGLEDGTANKFFEDLQNESPTEGPQKLGSAMDSYYYPEV